MEIPLAQPVPGHPGASWAVLPIPETPNLERLTTAERALFEQLSTDKRRREWWAGRAAARSALRAVGAGACSVLRHESGAPRLEGPGAERVSIAITHGKGFAAAIAAPLEGSHPHVGIDWVDASDAARIGKVAHRVLDATEQALCGDAPMALMLAWGAREATAKAAQTGMFVHALTGVHLRAIDPEAGTAQVDDPGVRIGFWPRDDGALVVCARMSVEARQLARERANLA